VELTLDDSDIISTYTDDTGGSVDPVLRLATWEATALNSDMINFHKLFTNRTTVTDKVTTTDVSLPCVIYDKTKKTV
jgi:hypothetical protein